MKVLVIGSGPIVIGQAAEFDYAGTQACKALKEEGHEVVLINSNPATIMTDPGVSDALYIEPLTVEFCERVIARERPDALLPTLGGQTGLNLATQLADQGILEKYGVKMLGTPLEAIRKAEDRESFRALMREIREPVPESWIVETPSQLEELLATAPYPCIVRPAYTLGGTGGGIAHSPEELLEIGLKGLKLSMRSQLMVERSLLGWKEIEYEVMRDSKGNCITVCNMENFDPMGVHTGDSIVVAPSQTLSDIEYHMLRTASLKIIRALGIEGGCNVQLAVNPDSFDYYIIEVNPRVSRSSALASKATGYPIARVAAKIAVGKTLDEIDNQVTGTTKACFEPALDYVVVKIPRWPFDKFASGDRTLFTQMKATGEVMAIDRTFEAALMKAIRGLEVKQKDLRHDGFATMPDEELREAIRKPTDERLWAIAEGLRRDWGVKEVNRISRVDIWFLEKMQVLVGIERDIANLTAFEESGSGTYRVVQEAFAAGFEKGSIREIANVDSGFIRDVAALRKAMALGATAQTMEALVAMRAQLRTDPSVEEGRRRMKLLLESDIGPISQDEFFAKYPVSDHKHVVSHGIVGASSTENRRIFKMVDTCAGEFESKTPYYYSTLEDEDDTPARDAQNTHGRDARATVLVLGSGPIRIGQGIEFDYSCVHCVWALQALGYRAVIINNNPETVSTDFDTGDGLYFEPVTHEDVLRVVEHEGAMGVVCQFGGQTAINLAEALRCSGVAVLGTSPDAIARAEDREQFDALLEELDIPRPKGKAVRSLEQAAEVAREVGYPVLVRPSFVLGGRAMEIVYDEDQLREFYGEAAAANPDQPVLVDQYVLGDEAEVDVISDGEDTLVPGIMEHIERAGVHSGDSMAVYPPVNLSEDVQAQMVRSACKIARALEVKGLMNIQFVIRDEFAYVLEVNPRASRTVPYLSKVTGVPMVDLGTRCMMGKKLRDLGYESGLWTLNPLSPMNGGEKGQGVRGPQRPTANSQPPTPRGHVIPESAFLGGAPSLPEPILYAVKAPVFSFQKLARVEPSLGPEMKSTGEVLGIDNTYEGALYKAMIAAGITFKGEGSVLMTVRDEDKGHAVAIGKELAAGGFRITATRGTHAALAAAGIASEMVDRITEPMVEDRSDPLHLSGLSDQSGESSNPKSENILDLIMSGKVCLMINTPSADRVTEQEAARIRRACIETGVPCVTSIDTAVALVHALEVFRDPSKASCLRLEEYFGGTRL
ncbi:MAG: carbamoyl-phosphate synthase large subunit [Fimbriimonadaceae bacterium]